jgi:hypothetical protein
MDTNQLRLISSYRVGTDLTDRLAHAVHDQATQAQALRYAADEIDRLRARVQELELTLFDDGRDPTASESE